MIKKIYDECVNKIKEEHIKSINDLKNPLFLISTAYPGVWLEHIYDSIMYAKIFNDYDIAYNTINTFIDYQKEDGQLPCFIKADGSIGYSQIQECVAFTKLAFMVYEMRPNIDFLKRIYEASKKWVNWLCENRMTLNKGLVEMFVGYDTGHDNSGRLEDMTYKGYYAINGTRCNAKIKPNCQVGPIIAVDMNCNLYQNLKYLAKISEILANGKKDKYLTMAANIKRNLFKVCYDKEDSFFYDVDKNGNMRKYLSSTIFHLFLEGVLDKKEDKDLINDIYLKHLSDKNEFNTNYPFPAMAINDDSFLKHKMPNSWGYYSQALIALRCSLWMDDYGYSDFYDEILKKWVNGLINNYDKYPMGQELDPITGESSGASLWYSSSMLLFLYAVNRLKLVKND